MRDFLSIKDGFCFWGIFCGGVAYGRVRLRAACAPYGDCRASMGSSAETAACAHTPRAFGYVLRVSRVRAYAKRLLKLCVMGKIIQR